MARFVDIPLDNGDPNKAVAALDAAVKASSDATTTQAKTQNTDTRTTKITSTDPRFVGKSAEEVVEMYRNLESHSGRLASQLGESRAAVNAIILGKRENDLRTNSTVAPIKVEAADLLSNPTEALDRYIQSRQNPEVQTLKTRLSELETQLGQSTFNTRHPNANRETADPAFQQWAQQTPLRMELTQRAANGDYRAAEMLLTEYKVATVTNEEPVITARERAQQVAGKLSLEGNAVGSEGGGNSRTSSSQTFKRADLIALRISNPDKYENPAFQREIVKAYQEGRVVD